MLAFDKNSKRKIDANGYLHVSTSHISKETVNQYIGKSIPGWKELGLDPNKVYNCYRKGSELEAGAKTFDGLSILWGHKAESAEAPRIKDRIGNMGTDAKFDGTYLDNSLIFNTKKGIDAINSGERVELSCSYRWTPVVQSGTFNGMAYDIIMTKIIGNHLGLVEEGRAGSDVMVHDSKEGAVEDKKRVSNFMETLNKFFNPTKNEGTAMDGKEKEAMDAGGMKEYFSKMSKDEQKGCMDEFTKIMAGKKEEKTKDEDPKEEKKKSEEKEKAKDEEGKEEKKEKKAEDAAMTLEEVEREIEKSTTYARDEAIKEITKKHQALTAAANDVKPVVGNLDALSFDSAEELYGKALELQGVKTEGFDPSSFPGMFSVLKANKSTPAPMAQDAKIKEFDGHFIGLKSVNIGA